MSKPYPPKYSSLNINYSLCGKSNSTNLNVNRTQSARSRSQKNNQEVIYIQEDSANKEKQKYIAEPNFCTECVKSDKSDENIKDSHELSYLILDNDIKQCCNKNLNNYSNQTKLCKHRSRFTETSLYDVTRSKEYCMCYNETNCGYLRSLDCNESRPLTFCLGRGERISYRKLILDAKHFVRKQMLSNNKLNNTI